MMTINCPHPPKKYHKNGHNNYKTFDVFAIIALGVSIYIANLGRQNLEYNKKSAETSKMIALELRQLNHSTLVKDLRDYLKNEEVSKK